MSVTRRAVLAGILVLVGGLLWVVPKMRSSGGSGVSGAGDAANPGITSVGTSGHTSTPEPESSPATLHDLETVTGSLDPHELIGSRVDFDLKVRDINSSTSFWVGTKDNPMLVVLGRNNRSEAQRGHITSANGIQPVKPGQIARITGTIEAIPPAESRYSWGVNDSVRRELKDQKVYIRADDVIPEG
jgi:hypothetical protein